MNNEYKIVSVLGSIRTHILVMVPGYVSWVDIPSSTDKGLAGQ